MQNVIQYSNGEATAKVLFFKLIDSESRLLNSKTYKLIKRRTDWQHCDVGFYCSFTRALKKPKHRECFVLFCKAVKIKNLWKPNLIITTHTIMKHYLSIIIHWVHLQRLFFPLILMIM